MAKQPLAARTPRSAPPAKAVEETKPRGLVERKGRPKSGEEAKPYDLRRLTVYLSPATATRLATFAAARGQTISAIAERAVSSFLDGQPAG